MNLSWFNWKIHHTIWQNVFFPSSSLPTKENVAKRHLTAYVTYSRMPVSRRHQYEAFSAWNGARTSKSMQTQRLTESMDVQLNQQNGYVTSVSCTCTVDACVRRSTELSVYSESTQFSKWILWIFVLMNFLAYFRSIFVCLNKRLMKTMMAFSHFIQSKWSISQVNLFE